MVGFPEDGQGLVFCFFKLLDNLPDIFKGDDNINPKTERGDQGDGQDKFYDDLYQGDQHGGL